MKQLQRPTRRGILIAHVAASVGWLGLTLCLLTLAISGATTASPATAEAAYRAMKLFGDWLLIPLALTTLATGLVMSLGTSWGLARHRWVMVKFWITLVATIASMFAFRAGINEAYLAVAGGEPVPDPTGLLFPPSVSLALYLFVTTVSILKPWGLTRRGRRERERQWQRRERGQRPSSPRPAAARQPV